MLSQAELCRMGRALEGFCHAEGQPQSTKVGLAGLGLLFLELCCFVPQLMLRLKEY